MQHIDLYPASQLANKYGIKSILYGGPGSAKTPTVASAPNVVLCATEPGTMSLRKTNIPVFEAHTPKKIQDFWAWVQFSTEARKFQTIAIDSVSQMAEIILEEKLDGKSKAGNKVDGKAAYGDMARETLKILNGLYFLQGPNVILIAKQDDKPDDGTGKKRPYFPGKDLHIKVPHLYDLILHMEDFTPVGSMVPQKAFRTLDSYNAVARDRSGFLAEVEPANFGYIFGKIEAGFKS